MRFCAEIVPVTLVSFVIEFTVLLGSCAAVKTPEMSVNAGCVQLAVAVPVAGVLTQLCEEQAEEDSPKLSVAPFCPKTHLFAAESYPKEPLTVGAKLEATGALSAVAPVKSHVFPVDTNVPEVEFVDGVKELHAVAAVAEAVIVQFVDVEAVSVQEIVMFVPGMKFSAGS